MRENGGSRDTSRENRLGWVHTRHMGVTLKKNFYFRSKTKYCMLVSPPLFTLFQNFFLKWKITLGLLLGCKNPISGKIVDLKVYCKLKYARKFVRTRYSAISQFQSDLKENALLKEKTSNMEKRAAQNNVKALFGKGKPFASLIPERPVRLASWRAAFRSAQNSNTIAAVLNRNNLAWIWLSHRF